ncbi:MAG: TonB-dependent receptor plug domain-containing protein, partial [Gammaproteobacteria bacterium]|nr:TonB-dependent receptor plug domain-containing protein [Gammaproteobacteria bacterium]
MKKIRYWSVAVGFYWMASLAYANSLTSSDELFELSLDQLMQLEVKIATGTQKTLSKAPAAVTLITADDLKKTGATNVIEALEGVPGVHVRYNRSFYTPFIHIRGTNTNQVILMVNGQSLRSVISPWPQDVFWKGMSVNAVERVEIIRGPGSALYGSQASAGVVNIITKTANDIEESEAGLRVGSFDTQSVFGQY